MNSLKEAIIMANVKVEKLAEYVNVPYFIMGQMIEGELKMGENIKSAIKFFLLKNYTERIDKLI